MTKEQLERQLALKEEEIHRLENAIDYLEEKLNKAESELNQIDLAGLPIMNSDDFFVRLKSDGLWSQELEDFIEYYFKFHN